MLEFNIEDMTCSHCAGAITRAVRQVDPDAVIEVVIAEKRVAINSVAPVTVLVAAIQAAGYTPVAV